MLKDFVGKEVKVTMAFSRLQGMGWTKGYTGVMTECNENYVTLGGSVVLSTKWIMSITCLLYTSPSPRDRQKSRMPSSA